MLENLTDSTQLKNLNIKDLKILADEIRQEIITTSQNNGGHIASNLGVVELTIALHYVFNLPKDKLIFDVGHQCYTHKILTGRLSRFNTIRKLDGLSGFPKREESEYDCFNTGHASTSISAAMGFAKARDLNGDNYEVISVIGDGSFNGGMVYEALNNISTIKSKLIIILNDNGMSISQTVGGMPKYLSRLRVNLKYRKLKKTTKNIFNKIPLIGKGIIKLLEGTKNFFGKFLLHDVAFFEHLGIKYVGPIDGNDVEEVIKFLNKLKYFEEPVLLHVVTKKGKGCIDCENSPEDFHGLKAKGSNSYDEYSNVLGKTLVKMSTKNKKIIGLTAAMCAAVGLEEFKNTFPDRFIDTGICEQHSVTLAAGFAANGFKPYFAVYSTFLQRAFDQILHDVCTQNLPVTFCVDRSGIVGSDGETHQGVFDLSYLSLMPNMVIAVPKDLHEFENFLYFSENFKFPLAIRYPRESQVDFKCVSAIEFGKWEYLIKGKSNIVIIACGERMLTISSKLYDDFITLGFSISVVNARFVKPLDYEMLNELANKTIITLEDNCLIGGFGGMIDIYYTNCATKTTIKNFAYFDTFIKQGDINNLMETYGVNYQEIKNYINSKIL